MLPNLVEASEIIEMIELIKVQNDYLLQIYSVLNFVSVQLSMFFGFIFFFMVMRFVKFLFSAFERW